ncbi:AMP-binding protein [Candidatus Mycobacterium wuenschmannii]|uniref:AMP-binding protein n=1 Tax=Candidatus Mycobacterium wuenschmannii TaxID=3027808 RepID=A0ABY8W476_9MYCO|nr:AMP-binding protein [Candidatus Mycobacterium wuenschmannii]WIM89995.1 AMP-binding protein [Candidatus Mycobacterium wuenschmannii]
MRTLEDGPEVLPLSRSQQNLYGGVLQDGDPSRYLIGKSYQFRPVALPRFLAALQAATLASPIQLCVLEASADPGGYPNLVARLEFDDVVRVVAECDDHVEHGLESTWRSGILAKPLVRYTVRTDQAGAVSGLEVHTHHILLDGGATGIIETDLARFLTSDADHETPGIRAGLVKLANAHHREAERVEDARRRLADTVRRELVDDAHRSHHIDGSNSPAAAATGVLQESVTLQGESYEALVALSEAHHIPFNILVAAAALAVNASLRQSTQCLLVHAVDNRFGDPDLNVATCLVNSVAHAVQFPPFTSVHDLLRTLDRSYVRAVRRRWIREEHYRRMYMATNHTSQIDTLTLNFIREPCAPELRPFLLGTPVATNVGPIEGMTVASVLNERESSLTLSIWDRDDLPASRQGAGIAQRIAAALESMAAGWDQPIAATVDEWFELGTDGTRCPAPSAAWFLASTGGIPEIRLTHRFVDRWLAWLVRGSIAPGTVVVCADDNTDKTTDLLIACHLAGCGYSVCDDPAGMSSRAQTIADHRDLPGTYLVDVANTELAEPDYDACRAIDRRIDGVAHDPTLAEMTAYLMPTSGSTGQPKLVRVSHGSLALFCEATREGYGWTADDIVLQCAPLTSDISVEEIFVAAMCGSGLVRSTATRTGDLVALVRDLTVSGSTILDLPTAIWHLLCDDASALEAVRRSRLRHIVIGGEPVRPTAVDKWVDAIGTQQVSLISTYGPTETTVVVTYLPLVDSQTTVEAAARLRLGRPLVAGTVFIAFGEVVVVGDLVSHGYLGSDNAGFGAVATPDGSRSRAFATADRVILDERGFFVFAGRKDAVVKVSGKRIDTAEVIRNISADPDVTDVAVEVHDGRLAVWFETHHTRRGAEDATVAARISLILANLRVPSSLVIDVPSIPRQPNGKVDSTVLRMVPEIRRDTTEGTEPARRAIDLAEIWSGCLGRRIGPSSSLLDEGVGSLDLIRILPESRSYLGWHITILDLISADTAINLVESEPLVDDWMDTATADCIEQDLSELTARTSITGSIDRRSTERRGQRSIVVLGATGILGTGFAQAYLDHRRSGADLPELVFVTRTDLPAHGPWVALRDSGGLRVEHLPSEFAAADVAHLVADAGTVINCIGNTNVLVPYRELRFANVEFVSQLTELCANRGAMLAHLSTHVVSADVTAARVTDPRRAPYPYAASKSLAEITVASSRPDLDFRLIRLPRVLGEDYQMRDSADVLVAVADACAALGARPALTLTEEVTTARAAAVSILALEPQSQPRCGLTVVRGQQLAYRDFLGRYGSEELDIAEWKSRVDSSDWAQLNPRRWSVVDAWITLGMMLGGRSYADYLSDYPTVTLGVEAVGELKTQQQSMEAIVDAAVCRYSEDSHDGKLCGTTR